MVYLVILLFVAHIFGDFYLQRNGFCEQKRDEAWYGWHKILHACIIYCLSWLVTWSGYGWWLAGIIAVSHWGIDVLKSIVEKNILVKESETKSWKDPRYLLVTFVVDQLLHLIIIVVSAYLWTCYNAYEPFGCFVSDFSNKVLLFVIAILVAHRPANILISLVLRFCQVGNDVDGGEGNHENFRSGALIGTFERLLIIFFVVLGQYEAIGFLIAAKSILRFPETTKGSEKAEYVLAGTFISVAIALLLGILIINKLWLL